MKKGFKGNGFWKVIEIIDNLLNSVLFINHQNGKGLISKMEMKLSFIMNLDLHLEVLSLGMEEMLLENSNGLVMLMVMKFR